VLYIVAHGSFVEQNTYLWLEDEAGKIARVAGDELVQRMRELLVRPRLVTLIACQTAGSGAAAGTADEGALAALGPRLADVGVPAVLAMQGNVLMQTVADFIPTFFEELRFDGQIDRAVAVARGAVRDQPDAWAPALYMRLKSGRIWYIPGFGSERENFEKWPALLRYLKRGQSTPIIGPHLSDVILGGSRDIAQAWAESYNYPMEAHERNDLPQVAQYLSVNQDLQFPRDELIEYLRMQLIERYAEHIPDAEQKTISELFAATGVIQRQRNAADPFKVLAELPLPVYVTTNASNLLPGGIACGREGTAD
jgi:hypothetical protein